MILFNERIDDYVAEDFADRVIDVFVHELDLGSERGGDRERVQEVRLAASGKSGGLRRGTTLQLCHHVAAAGWQGWASLKIMDT